MDIYKAGIRPLLFSGFNADPEFLHTQVMRLVQWLETHPNHSIARSLKHQTRQICCYAHPALEQTFWGCSFKNPLGLAAGFDKNGIGAGFWADLGFGFAELGTVTLHAQPGNPQPRLFRLLQDEAVLNRMGFNNQGAAAMAQRLQARGWGEQRQQGEQRFPIGINLGKSKITPLEEAVSDYVGSFRQLKPYGDYFVVNVSSPNTPGLRSLQATEQLEPILATLQQENQGEKPLLVKIAPDLEWEEITAIVSLAQTHQLAGIIATNTTIRRDHLKTQILEATGNPMTEEAGGISGAPVRDRSTEVIRLIYQQTQGELPIIGVGGIFTAEDAWEKITAGASLLQVYTGWIYEGPGMIKRVMQGLVQKLEEQGMKNIQAAVGMNAGSPSLR